MRRRLGVWLLKAYLNEELHLARAARKDAGVRNQPYLENYHRGQVSALARILNGRP